MRARLNTGACMHAQGDNTQDAVSLAQHVVEYLSTLSGPGSDSGLGSLQGKKLVMPPSWVMYGRQKHVY